MSPATRTVREILLLPFQKNRCAPSTCEVNTKMNHLIRASFCESRMLSFKAIPWLKLNCLSMLSFGCRWSCKGELSTFQRKQPLPVVQPGCSSGGGRGGILKILSWVLAEHRQLLFEDELMLLQVCPSICAWRGMREMVKQVKPH